VQHQGVPDGESPVVILVSLIAGLGLLALALALLAPLAPAGVDLAVINREVYLDPDWWRPEPLERFLFVAGVFLLPFCLGGSYLGVRRLLGTAPGRRAVELLESPVSWLVAPLALVLLCAAGFADDRRIVRTLIPGGALSLAASVLLAAGTVAVGGSRFREGLERLLKFLLPGLAGLLLLGLLLFGVLGPEHISNVPIFGASFNAVFYSVVQVFFGKQLLVNLTNQYGLYPHFIEPILSVVGLSVYSFTALMALLNCLAFACLYRFLSAEVQDRLLAFLGLTTIVFFGYVAGRVQGQDLYLQYHPIRTLFPAVSLLLVRAFAHGPTLRLSTLLFAVGAAAFLWNPDTGTILLLSLLLLVVYDSLLLRRLRGITARLVLGAAAVVGVLIGFSVAMWLRFGAFPDYGRLFLYSKGFYLYGMGMLPMPPFGLWVPVLTIYACALLLSLVALARGEATPRARILFFLSVLGVGLFSYYQGRSSLGNLMSAGYPAVVVGVLLAGDVRRQATLHLRPADRLTAFVVLVLLWYSVPALATVAPDWIRGIGNKIRITRNGWENEVLKDAKFLRYYVRPGQEIVIMSYHSGLHHLLTRTTNPLDIPGDSELLYRVDYDKQMDYVMKRRGTFAIDRATMAKDFVESVRRASPVSYDNPYGNLYVFPVPERSAPPRAPR
jgi:hypothetical protein